MSMDLGLKLSRPHKFTALGPRVFLKDRKFCEDEFQKKNFTRTKTQTRHICKD